MGGKAHPTQGTSSTAACAPSHTHTRSGLRAPPPPLPPHPTACHSAGGLPGVYPACSMQARACDHPAARARACDLPLVCRGRAMVPMVALPLHTGAQWVAPALLLRLTADSLMLPCPAIGRRLRARAQRGLGAGIHVRRVRAFPSCVLPCPVAGQDSTGCCPSAGGWRRVGAAPSARPSELRPAGHAVDTGRLHKAWGAWGRPNHPGF